MWWRYKPYVSVAARRAKAARQITTMEKNGQKASPVRVEGRQIARTFWGKAWCNHLESYSDYANRLPRGRTYVRNGSVVDLQITAGQITAWVAGSDLYKIEIGIKPATPESWQQIKQRCAGQIGSLIELLQGKFSQGVMQLITERDGGLFPAPSEIKLDCSCPDWAGMCKHLAAVLYGVGARLDRQPELLFLLRKVDHLELIAQAGDVKALSSKSTRQKTIAAGDLADVFGIELEAAPNEPVHVSPTPPSRRPGRKPGSKTTSTRGKKKSQALPAKPLKPKAPPKRRKAASVRSTGSRSR